VHTRFQAGMSGNLGGRPKGSKNLKSLARKVMSTEVPIRENGKVRMISKAEALVMTVSKPKVNGVVRRFARTSLRIKFP
jgi:hypothetical protein